MSVNDRINQIIAHLSLTVAAFSRKIGVGDQTVRSVCVLHRNRPSFEFIARIIQSFPWINPDWLLLGIGEMKRSDASIEIASESNQNSQNLERLIEYLKEKDKKIESLIEEKALWRFRYEQACVKKTDSESEPIENDL